VKKAGQTGMKHTREYEIAWQGLKLGLHTFQYDLDDKFIEALKGDNEVDFKDLDVQVSLKFDKKESFFMCHFDVDGSITAVCDRCGDDFKLRLWDEFDLIIKLTGAEDAAAIEDDADVVFIPRSETVLDISNWLYEFVILSIPLQRVHPDKENGESGCNPEALKLLNKLSEPPEKPENTTWKGIEALKGLEKKTNKK
jgi:uncharacterized metal-binding protein YceD (DUF177 family)